MALIASINRREILSERGLEFFLWGTKTLSNCQLFEVIINYPTYLLTSAIYVWFIEATYCVWINQKCNHGVCIGLQVVSIAFVWQLDCGWFSWSGNERFLIVRALTFQYGWKSHRSIKTIILQVFDENLCKYVLWSRNWWRTDWL